MKPYQHQTHYELLEVPVDAGVEQLRAAHERLQALYAPDSVALYTLADPGEADALRERIAKAFAVLSEPSLRAEYDAQLRAAAAAAPPPPVVPPRAAPVPRAAPKARKPRAPRAPKTPKAAASAAVTAPAPVQAQGGWSTTSFSVTYVPVGPAPAVTSGWQFSVAQAAQVNRARAEPAVPVTAPPQQPPAPPLVEAEPAAVPTAAEPLLRAAPEESADTEAPPAAPSPVASAAAPPSLPPPMERVVEVARPALDPGQHAQAEAAEPAAGTLPAVSAPVQGPSAPVAPEPHTPRPVPGHPRETTLPLFGAAAGRAIPPWPTTGEALLPADEEDPITDTHTAVPAAAEEEPEEIDPGELMELEPEPGVDAAGEPRPVQQQLSFDPSQPPAPPPLPRKERTVTPVQFRQLDTSWGFKVPEPGPLGVPAPPSPTPVSVLPPEAAPVSPAAPPAQEVPVTPQPAEPVPEPVAAPPPAPTGSHAPPPAENALVLASAARPRETRPRTAELPPDAVFNGELLRKVRTAQGLTLDDISGRTRISKKTLENVEADKYAELPALVYLRGTLMSLATALGLDPLRVSKGYLDLYQASRAPRR